jgi:hypothetical protein
VSGKATPPPWIDADWWHRLTNPLKPQAFRNGFDHRTEEYVMGEARRRMRVAAIGAEISWSDDRLKAAIRQPKFITIGELEDMARAYMADDPVTFVPAKAFVLERQELLMSDGSSVAVMVKVHPDPRVQRVLYQMREAPLLNAMAEVDDATDGNAEGVLMLLDKVVLPGRDVSETNFGSRRRIVG